MKIFSDETALQIGRHILDTYQEYLDGKAKGKSVVIPVQLDWDYELPSPWCTAITMDIPYFVVRTRDSFKIVSVEEYLQAKKGEGKE